ncbi:hypothetical protein OHAE_3207 [Ochrobactrum soli]|uniref:Uncharacterized protein n=1 Tax=Ochrobactrum soli TaxID=2448455 RepID=A0A2P9HGN2_9HYPH|nr:hypothetical protein OHAE_3207 [[Ochrobactrum] soli]
MVFPKPHWAAAQNRSSEPLWANERIKKVDRDEDGDQSASDIFDQHVTPSKLFADAQITKEQTEKADADCQDGDVHNVVPLRGSLLVKAFARQGLCDVTA